MRIAVALLAVAPAAAQARDPIDRWHGPIAEAAVRFGVPEAWIRRVMRAESGGRTHVGGRPIESRAGAMGLMQLMPGTWREMRAAHRLGLDPHDPHDNILAGAAYLRAMYDRFGYPGLFGAYNAGPARYLAYVRRARPLPPETVAYVEAVASAASVRAAPRARSVSLFARNLAATSAIEASVSPLVPPARSGIFVPLTLARR